MNQSETCIVFFTHLLDEEVLANYRKLKNECSSMYDLFLAYDNSREDFKDHNYQSESEVYLYSKNDLVCRKLNSSNGTSTGIIPGNLHYIHLDFIQHHTAYKYIWRIEYDVFYTGNWAHFFTEFEDCEADLLAPSFLDYDQIPLWYWWNRLYSPHFLLNNSNLDCYIKKIRGSLLERLSPYFRCKILPLNRYLVRCLLCVSRLSRKGAELVGNRTKCGWRGHEEVLLPTLLKAGGLSIEDIGGTGRYVKDPNFRKNYSNRHDDSRIYSGTLRAQPEIPSESITRANMLYHPVKKGLFEQLEKWQ